MSFLWKTVHVWAVLVCVFYCVHVTDAFFDCRRSGMVCINSTCNFFGDGDCINCPEGYAGRDCGFNESLSATGCECQNGGTCFREDGALKCYCGTEFVGDNCETNRASVDCKSESMIISIAPYPGFQGLIYMTDTDGDPECLFNKSMDGDMEVYTNTFDLETGCNGQALNDTPAEGDKTYIRDVIIRYNPDTVNALDQFVNIKCEYKAANLTAIGGTMTSVSVDAASNLTKETATTAYVPVLLEIQEESGDKLVDDVYIGRPLRLQFSLKDTLKYTSINVERCLAVNGKSDTERKEQLLIDQSCPTRQSAGVITKALEKNEDQTKIYVYFNAFKFVDSSDLEFECKVRHCVAGDNSCDAKECYGTMTGFGRRRKRDADEDTLPEEEIIKSRKIRVLDPGARNIISGGSMKPEECLQRTEILSSLIILASAVSILLIAIVFLALKVIRSRSPKLVAHDNDTDSSVSSGGTRMRIPRIRAVYQNEH